MQNLDTSGAKIIPTPVRINETAQEKCKDNAEPEHPGQEWQILWAQTWYI